LKNFMKKKWLGIPVVAIIAVLLVGVVAASVGWLVTCSIGGSGTITVPEGTHATHGIQIISPSAVLSFSGSLPTPDGGYYTKTVVVQVKNTGTNGTGGWSSESATITAISVGGAPSGFTTSTDWTSTLIAGATTPINITLTSTNPVTSTTVLPAFTITVSGSGS
jgi:hypothetical protein